MSPAAAQHGLGNIRLLPLRYDNADSEASALRLIRALVPEWGTGDSRVDLLRFTDGITNTLLKATNVRPGLSKADIDRHAILLRAYGNGTDILIDREREAANHELLMRHHLAPELLARFENGMLYRFVPGIVAQPQDLIKPSVAAAVARKLAEWHATVPCLFSLPHDSSKQNGKPNGSHPDRATNGHVASPPDVSAGKQAPNVWTTMQKWIMALPTDSAKQRERQALLNRELQDMVAQLGRRPGLGQDGV
jgi:ethanolamine kinase